MEQSESFQKFYKEDLEEVFPTECNMHFRHYVQGAINEEGLENINLLKFIRERDLEDLFPNANIALQVFFWMAVTSFLRRTSILIS